MADIELVIKIDEEYVKQIDRLRFSSDRIEDRSLQINVINAIKNGIPLRKKVDSEAIFSKLDRCMECMMESDHRSFSNPETENGWIFDHILEWRKMIRPYIKEE